MRSKKIKSRLKIHRIYQIGFALRENGSYEEALEVFYKLAEIRNKGKEKDEGMLLVMQHIAFIKSKLERFGEAQILYNTIKGNFIIKNYF